MTTTPPALPAPGTPTQVAHPGKATIRTVVQNVLSAILVGAIVAPIVLGIIGDELGDYVPASAMTVLIAGVAALVAISAAITRIMAIPQLQPFLVSIGLGTGVESERGRHAAVDPTYPDDAQPRAPGEPPTI